MSDPVAEAMLDLGGEVVRRPRSGAVFWTASGKVLDGVKEGAGRRRTRCWTASSKVLDGVQEGARRRLANRPTPSGKKRSLPPLHLSADF